MRLGSECTSLHHPIKIAATYVPKQAPNRTIELSRRSEGNRKRNIYISLSSYASIEIEVSLSSPL